METDSPTPEELLNFPNSRCKEQELSKRELATGSKATTHPEKPKRITQFTVAVDTRQSVQIIGSILHKIIKRVSVDF